MLTVTLWESEEAMHATDEHAHCIGHSEPKTPAAGGIYAVFRGAALRE